MNEFTNGLKFTNWKNHSKLKTHPGQGLVENVVLVKSPMADRDGAPAGSSSKTTSTNVVGVNVRAGHKALTNPGDLNVSGRVAATVRRPNASPDEVTGKRVRENVNGKCRS